MNKEKYESENKLDKIQMEMNKNKIKNELEILKMKKFIDWIYIKILN